LRHERFAPKTKRCGAQAPSPATTHVDTNTFAYANQTRLAQPLSAVFRSCFFSAFSDLPSSDLFSPWGYWIPYPPPLLHISKGLRRFLPMTPHLLSLQTKTLTSFLPISSPIFHAKKYKRNGFPLRILPMFAIAQDPAFCPTYED
jgi:hypothetical protein